MYADLKCTLMYAGSPTQIYIKNSQSAIGFGEPILNLLNLLIVGALLYIKRRPFKLPFKREH